MLQYRISTPGRWVQSRVVASRDPPRPAALRRVPSPGPVQKIYLNSRFYSTLTEKAPVSSPGPKLSPEVPTLAEFMASSQPTSPSTESEIITTPTPIPYLDFSPTSGQGRSVFVESYGCQMNVSDSDIVYSIMLNSGFIKAPTAENADILFLNTCAIREHAEDKIWSRLGNLKAVKKEKEHFTVGVLGCMAERLKDKLIDQEKLVDIVAGPDAYRDLPRLISRVDGGEKAVNTLLSLEETYADISPVRFDDNGVSAYVTIMRGCNNMCTFCIVPFTRGRERSRPAESIVAEVKALADKGYKEVVLLGQNVNSYNDTSLLASGEAEKLMPIVQGFETVYKRPKLGISFTELMDKVSQAVPDMRIRFTSPHPKDFPDDVRNRSQAVLVLQLLTLFLQLLKLISERPNLAKSLHMPVQSGSSEVLKSGDDIALRDRILTFLGA